MDAITYLEKYAAGNTKDVIAYFEKNSASIIAMLNDFANPAYHKYCASIQETIDKHYRLQKEAAFRVDSLCTSENKILFLESIFCLIDCAINVSLR